MSIAAYEPATGELVHAPIDPTGGRLIAWAESMTAAHQLASALCRTSFVPKHFAGKPEEAAAALMLGDELGLSPVSALRSVFVISGTPGLYARTMVALVQSRGHEVWTEADTPTKVTVCARRAGSDKVERSEWTIDRARRAGYTNNKKYETDPQAMLYARAASDVCRRIAADVLAGVPHTVEELELEQPQQNARKVQRATAARVPTPANPFTPEPEFDNPAAIAAVPDAPEPEPDVQPEPGFLPETPQLITPQQLKALHASLNEVGLSDRDEALAYYARVIKRPVGSSKALTMFEASDVLFDLDRCSKGEPNLVDPATANDPELGL